MARAAGGIALLPLRTLDYWMCREPLVEELEVELSAPPIGPDPIQPLTLPPRPLRIFISCAESSGEIHAGGLVRALERMARETGAPKIELRGLGGDRLRECGVETIGDPVSRSAMGFDGVLDSLPYYFGMIEDVAREFRSWRPDLYLPLDSPALHVPIAHVAKGYGIPVVHFVAPQYWGWAPWRVGGYRQAVDLALTILPFEKNWFERRGIAVRHVGHPLLDHLSSVPTRDSNDESDALCILPGSRAKVIGRNLPWMLETLETFEARFPRAPVQVLQDTGEHREMIQGLIAQSKSRAQLVEGELHTNLRRARCAFSVSGTVLIDLLHHRLPTVVIYRLKDRFEGWLSGQLLTAPYFASINLLAGTEVVPEHCFTGEGPRTEVRKQVELAYGNAPWRTRCGDGLERAARRLGPAGAIERAAAHSLELACKRIVGAAPLPGSAPSAPSATRD